MRGWMGLLVSACVAVSLGAPGVAAAVGRKGEPVDDPTLTSSVQQEWKDATWRKEAEMASASALSRAIASATATDEASATPGPTAAYGLHTLSAANYMQETTYYCGPASARQSLSWHKSRSGSSVSLPSQRTLAGKIGTTSSGSLTTGIARAMNGYNGVFGNVNYVASNITDTGSPKSAFYTRIGWMLESARTVPIILTATRRIPRYSGHSSRHYMSVSGIDDRTTAIKMRSVDPNYNPAYRGVFWDPMGSTSSDGLCRACYQADVDGSNMVMCW